MEYLAQCLALVLLLPMMAHAADLEADKAEAAVSMPQENGGATLEMDARRAVLEQRVNAQWEALIRRDFPAAYTFTSPAYREAFSLEAYRRNFGTNARVAWRRIEVTSVNFTSEETATVGIKIYFVYHDPQSQAPIEMSTYVQESWILAEGKWWRLVEK